MSDVHDRAGKSDQKPILNSDEAAGLLGVSRTTFWRLQKEDARFPQPSHFRGLKRWTRAALIAYVQAIEPPPPTTSAARVAQDAEIEKQRQQDPSERARFELDMAILRELQQIKGLLLAANGNQYKALDQNTEMLQAFMGALASLAPQTESAAAIRSNRTKKRAKGRR